MFVKSNSQMVFIEYYQLTLKAIPMSVHVCHVKQNYLYRHVTFDYFSVLQTELRNQMHNSSKKEEN